MKKNRLIAASAVLVFTGAVAVFLFMKRKKSLYPELKTAEVDLEKYLGKWYDIAHLPAWFLDKCFNTTAEYSKNEDGSIKVLNTCNKGSLKGKEDVAEGTARVVDQTKHSKLEVEFLWPFKGDYWIIEVGEHYDFALVGEPSRQYLWILSRTPKLDEDIMSRLISRANEEGFATNNLVMTKHHL